jgi:transposase
VKQVEELKRQGLSISQISRITDYDPKTIRKYLRAPGVPQYGPRAPRPTKLDPFRAYIDQRLQQGVWNAAVLLSEIKERGYTGGYTQLKDCLRPLRQAAYTVAVRRFETPPGKQAQVDWGHVGQVIVGQELSKLSGFVLTLGYSRAMFADIALDRRLVTFLRLHEEAFAYLGGVPQEILYDQMKTVLLGFDERGEPRWQSTFADFARYWGFIPRVCQGYRPQTKGKVESGIKYVSGNFLCGREAQSVPELRGQLFGWTAGVANVRVHGTTHRLISQAWEEEKPHLLPVMGRAPYSLRQESTRRVSRDAFVAWKNNRYSVPWQAAGQEVLVREDVGKLWIEHGGALLAVHPICSGLHQLVIASGHHVGIPLWPSGGRGRKSRLRIEAPSAPVVEVRPLSVYEEALP